MKIPTDWFKNSHFLGNSSNFFGPFSCADFSFLESELVDHQFLFSRALALPIWTFRSGHKRIYEIRDIERFTEKWEQNK